METGAKPTRNKPHRRGDARVPAGSHASPQLLNLAWITAVRGSAADRVGRLDADRQVYVGAVGIERIVTGELQFGAGLPPAVPRGDDAVRQSRIELSTGTHPGARRCDRQPIALADTASGSGRWT